MSSDDSDFESLQHKPKSKAIIFSDSEDESTKDKSKFFQNENSETKCENSREVECSYAGKSTLFKGGFKSTLITSSDLESDEDIINVPLVNSANLMSTCSKSTDNLSTKGEEVAGEIDVEKSLQSTSDNENTGKSLLTNKLKSKPKNKQPLSEKLKIISERQRLSREMPVNLPYHIPKQRTLKEFLSRTKHELPVSSLRCTNSAMLEKWKKIDEDIKHVATFFKSDSEDEDEEEIENVVDKSTCDDDNPTKILSAVENMANLCHGDEESVIYKACDVAEPAGNSNVSESHESAPDINIQEQTSDLVRNVPGTCPNAAGIIDLDNSALPFSGTDVQKLTNTEDRNENNKVDSSLDDVQLRVEMIPPPSPPVEKVGKWLENICALEKSDLIRKHMLTDTAILNHVPTLTRESDDDFIDLDGNNKTTSVLASGAKELMDRLFKSGRTTYKSKTVELTTSSTQFNDSGRIDGIVVEKIVLNSALTTEDFDNRPGHKLQTLREKLKKDIEAKWEEEYKKRCAEQSLGEKEGFENDVSEDHEIDEEIEEISSSGESEPEEEDIVLEDKPRRECVFGDAEAEESDGEADDEGEASDNCNESSDEEQDTVLPDQGAADDNGRDDFLEMDCSLPAFQPGGGLLHGGSELTQQTQPLPLQSLSPTLSVSRLKSSWKSDENIAMEDVKSPTTLNSGENVKISPNEVTRFGSDDAMECNKPLFSLDDFGDDPYQFVSGVFSGDEKCASQPLTRRIIIPDDSEDSCSVKEAVEDSRPTAVADDDEVENLELKTQTSPGLTIGDDEVVTMKKMKKRLAFSDDEDDTDTKQNEDNCDDVQESEIEDDEAVNDGGAVEYDSEENEIVRGAVNAKQFLENEAELSESEWSGDEDERGLDMLDAEAGDADVLDHDQVQSQLGRIHMRRMLDQDARDVRLLQELLFEDGDLYSGGKGRDRKFRWKNLTGFERSDGRAANGSESEGEDEQTEIELAKLRHERSQWLLQLQKEGKEIPSSAESVDKDPLLQLGKRLLNRIQNKPLNNVESKQSAPRGSFLAKDSDFLLRLGRLTGGVKEGPLGPTNSRNFVFHAQNLDKDTSTVEEASVSVKVVKRKAINSKEEVVKKLKLVQPTVSETSLLDQLH